MAIGLYNHTKGARRVGAALVLPGSAAVLQDESWRQNKVVQAWIKAGDLQEVTAEEVEKINAGMDIKKAKAVKEAEAKQADTAPAGNTPPTGNTPPAAGNK